MCGVSVREDEYNVINNCNISVNSVCSDEFEVQKEVTYLNSLELELVQTSVRITEALIELLINDLCA